MVKLENFSQNQTTEVIIIDPLKLQPLQDENGNLVKAIVHGSNSDRYAAVAHKLKLEVIESTKNKKIEFNHTVEKEWERSLVIGCVEKIEGLSFNGKDLDTPEVIEEVLKNPKFDWLYKQLLNAANDISNFMQV